MLIRPGLQCLAAIQLDCSEGTMLRRVEARAAGTHRGDDITDTASRILERYRESSPALVKHFTGLGVLHTVDSEQPVGPVMAGICH